MEHFLVIFNTKPQFAIFFIFLLISSKISCEETLDNKIKAICLKAESSVKFYFEEKQELPEKFKNLKFTDEISENKLKSVINLLLLDEETKNNFMQTKNNEKKYIKIIKLIIVVVSAIFALDFEIHFFFRLFFRKNIFNPSLINFYKISPFYWIFYFILNKQKVNLFYDKFLNKHTNKKRKFIIYIFCFIIFAIMLIIFIMTYFVSNECENSSQVTINVLCTSIKFFNELKNGKQIKKDGSHLIGFKDINSFLNELFENQNLFKTYFNNYTETYNEINNNLNEWDKYLNEIQKNLSDKNSLNYYFYNYPSNPDFIICNFNNQNACKESLYQTKLIYDYYPYDNNTKTLWIFNNNLYNNTEILLEKFKIFEHFFIESEYPFNFCFENVNLKNGFSKLDSIINIYIQQILEIDKENIFDKFIYSYLSNLYSFDFILLIFIGLNTLLALIYIEYYCVRKHYFGRIIISVIFQNIFFIILSISFIKAKILKKININFLYIKEISKGIYYILNDEIDNLFNEKNNSYFKNISLFMEFKNSEMNNNLFNYIIYYINNENELKTLLNDKILYINTTQLKIINDSLNDVNKTNLTALSSQINDFSETILNIINEGLKYSTYFVDLTSTGYLNTYLESPVTYLSYVNNRTRKKAREDFGYKEILCDEIWDISSTFDFFESNYEYKSRDFVLCENCNNICSNEKILLNFMEYTIDEIEQRYSHLKNGINNDTYYELMYYFNSTENLRNKKIFDQLKDLYEINENLNNIQNNIFNSIKKMEYIAKTIIKIYENIINKYEKEDTFFNYTEYIKNDLYYLIGQIEINFSQKISKEYKQHLNINIICILICFTVIIFYLLFAKEMRYYKKESDNESKSKSNIEDGSSIEENGKSAIIQNSIKIGKINVEGNKQGNQNIMNIINTYIINEEKCTKINKDFDNNNNVIGYDTNKNKKSMKSVIENNVGFLGAKKIVVNRQSKKNVASSEEIDENRNDESRDGLNKGIIIENKNKNVCDNINKDSQHRLNSENKIIRNLKIINK